MSSDFRFELNSAGVRELLKSPGIQNALVAHASAVKNRAGDGYDVFVGSTRANVSVRTVSESAAKDNLRNNTLLKAMGGK